VILDDDAARHLSPGQGGGIGDAVADQGLRQTAVLQVNHACPAGVVSKLGGIRSQPNLCYDEGDDSN
jgi:hypothetical protein